MLQCVIMRGIPGSGKTYHARQHFSEGVTYSADHYFDRLGRFDPKLLTEAHQECYKLFVGAVAAKMPFVVVDNTNLTPAEIAPYYMHAQAFGYEVKIVNVITDFYECRKRQTHSVPDDKLWQMYQTMQSERLPPWWKVGLLF